MSVMPSSLSPSVASSNLLEPDESFPHSAFLVWRARQQLNHRASRQMGCGLREEAPMLEPIDTQLEPTSPHQVDPEQNDIHTSTSEARSSSPPSPIDVLIESAPLRGFLSATTRKLSTYKTALCRSWEENGGCRYAAKCLFAHGSSELRSRCRRSGARSEFCKQWIDTGRCTFGQNCIFVHPTGIEPVSPPSHQSRRTSLDFSSELVRRHLQHHYTPADQFPVSFPSASPTSYTSDLESPLFRSSSRRTSVTSDEDDDETTLSCPPTYEPRLVRHEPHLDFGLTLPTMIEEDVVSVPSSPRVTVTRRTSNPWSAHDDGLDILRIQEAVTTSFGPPSPEFYGAPLPSASIPYAVIAFGVTEPSPSLAGCWATVLAAFAAPSSAFAMSTV